MTVTYAAALTTEPDRQARDRWNVPAAFIAAAIFAGLSLVCAISSKGFLEGDSITHFSMARFALREHHYLVSVWGRPLVTGLYVFPAQYGPIGVRLVSLTLALICSWVTYRLAREHGFRWPALAVICLFAQPLFFLHSFSELTELPFATLLILAFWAYQRRHFLVMAILVALLPLGRPEGFAFIGLACVGLVAHRRWYWLWILPIPILLWSWIGWIVTGRLMPHWWMWLPGNWPYSARSPYNNGPLLQFVGQLPMLISPVIFPALGIGLWQMYKQGAVQAQVRNHLGYCKLLIVAIPLVVLAGHSVLWRRGLQASAGQLRYLVITAPMWALLCGCGWEWVFNRWNLRSPLLWAGFAALLPGLINTVHPVLPIPEYDADLLGKTIAQWYRGDADIHKRYPQMMASLPSVFYYLDMSASERGKTADWGKGNVENNPNGTVLIWDPEYGTSNSDQGLCVPRPMLADPKNGWVFLRRYVQGPKHCLVFLSRYDINGKPTTARGMEVPPD